jgi:hypothetical protein
MNNRLAVLVELRRDGLLDDATRAELDGLLADPAIAAEACAAERTALLLGAALAPGRDGTALVQAVRANVLADRSRGLRVVRGVRRRLGRGQRRWALAAAAVVLVLLGGALLLRSERRPPPLPAEPATAAGGNPPSAAPARADGRWDAEGLRGLEARDDGWLAEGRPMLRDGEGRDLAATWMPSRDGGSLRAGPWQVEVTYRPATGGVAMTVELSAAAEAPALRVGIASLAGAAQEPAEAWTRDQPAILALAATRGRLLMIGEADEADFAIAAKPFDGRQLLELRYAGLSTGERRTATVYLGAAPPGGEAPLLDERLRAFAERHPHIARWEGLGRLGIFGYAGGALPTAANPNCWFDSRIDVRTEAGRQRFRELLLADADAAIANARRLGVQGVLFWGLEGSLHLNEVGFIADPRRLAELAPEMDAVADELFARFRAAGLRTGTHVRPWRLELGAGAPHFVFDGAQGEAELADRIAYARQRWGCSLFMVMCAANNWHSAAGMPPAALARIAQRFPDIALASDMGGLAWRSAAAGWDSVSARRGDREPRFWRRVYPQGRDLLFLDDDPMAAGTAEALGAGLADGGVPILWLQRESVAAWGRLLDQAGR